MGEPVLAVEELRVLLGWGAARRKVLDGVDLVVSAGTIHALVGESGSGKSTLARTVVGLIPLHSGTVRVAGIPVTPVRRRTDSALAHRVQMVFQSPYSSLDGRYQVGATLAEAARCDPRTTAADVDDRVAELLRLVALDPGLAHRYPWQLSGGQRQRVAIARALAPRPELLVADEVTSSLDVSVQAQIIELLIRLRDRLGLSILMITHDLAVADHLAQDVSVMLAGQIVERGRECLRQPSHPYTRTLVDAVITI